MLRLMAVIIVCTICVFCANKKSSPRIVIIGAGAAGIGASSRLLANGFKNVTILEAENRIGGRVHSIKFGEYMIDLGGQWIHGEKGNVAFELAWPLGLLERFADAFNFTVKLFSSSGTQVSEDISTDLMLFFLHAKDHPSEDVIEHLKTGTMGEYAIMKLTEYFTAHREIAADLYKPILRNLCLTLMGLEAADSWYEIPVKSEIEWTIAEGDHNINWKEGAYNTILDILMKKYPNPREELPVLNNTILNNKVTKINYNQAVTRITTLNGREFTADHVIFTASLGILKAKHVKLFDPPLPNKKINSIENIGFGHVGKIFLHYNEPWWPIHDDIYMKSIIWTEEDRKKLENDPYKMWMLGVTYFYRVEHKPKLLAVWLSSNRSIEMEHVPEVEFRTQIIDLIEQFFGSVYNLTQPTKIIRTLWNNNENFLGTYSYRSLQSDATKANHEHIAEPIVRNGKPILQFAGEATDNHWGTVHGAISSGWREADRLIDFYMRKRDEFDKQ